MTLVVTGTGTMGEQYSDMESTVLWVLTSGMVGGYYRDSGGISHQVCP